MRKIPSAARLKRHGFIGGNICLVGEIILADGTSAGISLCQREAGQKLESLVAQGKISAEETVRLEAQIRDSGLIADLPESVTREIYDEARIIAATSSIAEAIIQTMEEKVRGIRAKKVVMLLAESN